MSYNIRRVRRNADLHIQPKCNNCHDPAGNIHSIRRRPKTKCTNLPNPTLTQRVSCLENEVADINVALADQCHELNHQHKQLRRLEKCVLGKRPEPFCPPGPYPSPSPYPYPSQYPSLYGSPYPGSYPGPYPGAYPVPPICTFCQPNKPCRDHRKSKRDCDCDSSEKDDGCDECEKKNMRY